MSAAKYYKEQLSHASKGQCKANLDCFQMQYNTAPNV